MTRNPKSEISVSFRVGDCFRIRIWVEPSFAHLDHGLRCMAHWIVKPDNWLDYCSLFNAHWLNLAQCSEFRVLPSPHKTPTQAWCSSSSLHSSSWSSTRLSTQNQAWSMILGNNDGRLRSAIVQTLHLYQFVGLQIRPKYWKCLKCEIPGSNYCPTR